MFRIAICDDEDVICSQIETIIFNYKKETVSEKMEVEIFYSGEELCQYINKEHDFDLVFLDIELKFINGIEVGRIIREDMKNDMLQIVYISSKKGYAMELFQNRPLNFLIKPINETDIIQTLKKSLDLSVKENQFYEFSIGKFFYKIQFRDILYFESDAKKIRIITVNGTKECYGKLSDIQKKLYNKDFLQIHKSYLVNYLFVAEYQYDVLKLTNGDCLSISQTYRKNIRDYLLSRRKGR